MSLQVQKRMTLPATVEQGLASRMPTVYKLLPPDIEPERFRAALWLHLYENERLLKAEPASILDCTVKAASDGLMPGQECFFLPFKGKASYVRHYQGLIRVLERTGKVQRAFAHPVYQGDQFTADYFADRPSHISHVVLGTEPGPIRFYYGAVILQDGTCHFEVVSLDYIASVRASAPGREQEPWMKHPVEMSRKTALNYTCKYVKLTPKIAAMLDEEARLDPPTDAQARATIADLYGDTPALSPGVQTVQAVTAAHETSPHAAQAVSTATSLPDDGWRAALTELLPALDGHLYQAQCKDALGNRHIAPGQGAHMLSTARDVVAGLEEEAAHG